MEKTENTSKSKSPNSATNLLPKDNKTNIGKMNTDKNEETPLHMNVLKNKPYAAIADSKSKKSSEDLATELPPKDSKNNSGKMNADTNDETPLQMDVMKNKSNSSSQDLNKEQLSRDSKDSASKMHKAKAEHPRNTVDSTKLEDAYQAQRHSLNLLPKKQRKDSKNPDNMSKSQTSQDLVTESKTSKGSKKSAEKKNIVKSSSEDKNQKSRGSIDSKKRQ